MMRAFSGKGGSGAAMSVGPGHVFAAFRDISIRPYRLCRVKVGKVPEHRTIIGMKILRPDRA